MIAVDKRKCKQTTEVGLKKLKQKNLSPNTSSKDDPENNVEDIGSDSLESNNREFEGEELMEKIDLAKPKSTRSVTCSRSVSINLNGYVFKLK